MGFLKTRERFTTLQFEEVNGWSVGQVLLLEPREKSHGQVDEATLPLCVMLRKLHVFPSEKGKKHQFCLPSVGNSSARISKGGL